jgi:hypothetical protein
LEVFLFLPLYCILIFFSIHKIQIIEGNRVVLKKIYSPLAIIIFLYLFSLLSSFFIQEDLYPTFYWEKYNIYHFLIYHSLLAFCFVPIYFIKDITSSGFELKKTKSLTAIFYLMIIFIVFAFLYQLPYAYRAMQMNTIELRVIIRTGYTVLPQNFLTTIAAGISQFYVVFTFLFYYSIKEKFNILIKLGFFLGTFTYILTALTFGGRDGTVFFILTHIFCFLLYRNQFEPKVRKTLVKFVYSGIAISASFLILISVRRFYSGGDVNELIWGTLGYFGQQPYVFAENIIHESSNYGFTNSFPFFYSLFGVPIPAIERTEVYQWSFGTFLASFYALKGWSSLLIFIIIKVFIFSIVFLFKKRINPISFYMIILFYFQLMTTGVFYFKLGNRTGNTYMFMFLIIILLIPFFIKKNRQ